jgi:hypothetical protein
MASRELVREDLCNKRPVKPCSRGDSVIRRKTQLSTMGCAGASSCFADRWACCLGPPMAFVADTFYTGKVGGVPRHDPEALRLAGRYRASNTSVFLPYRTTSGRCPSIFGAVRPEIRLRGDPRYLNETWNDVFKPSLEVAATELLPVIDQHLRTAQRDINLSDQSGSAETLGSPLDPIATSTGAGYSESVEFLVEVARDCMEYLLEHNVSAAEQQLAAWTSSSVTLLRALSHSRLDSQARRRCIGHGQLAS